MQCKTAISYIDNINELCLAEIESLFLQSTLCMLYCDKFTCTRHIHSKTGCIDITSQTSKTFLMGIHLPLRKIFVHIYSSYCNIFSFSNDSPDSCSSFCLQNPPVCCIVSLFLIFNMFEIFATEPNNCLANFILQFFINSWFGNESSLTKILLIHFFVIESLAILGCIWPSIYNLLSSYFLC